AVLAQSHDQAVEHAIMATRARLLSDPAVDSLRAELAQARSVATHTAAGRTGLSSKAIGQLYGGALAALKLRELASASGLAALALGAVNVDTNSALVPAPYAQAAIVLLASEIAMAQAKYPQAQALLQPYLPGHTSPGTALSPFARSAMLLWAQSHIAQGAGRDELILVNEQLQSWVAQHPQDALAWDALAGVYTLQNQPLRAIRAQAEARVALLDYTAALDRFKAGQALARQAGHTDHMELSIIDSRTRTVQGLVRELHSDKPAN
ncbi:MAG: hypothetical protein WB821_11610, partial [Burkholderiaceae bacterium]